LGPSAEKVPPGIEVTRVESAQQMFDACVQKFDRVNWAIMSAAVADYRPMEKANQKIKKKEETLTIELVKNEDILKHLGTKKKNGQCLVGFALETNTGGLCIGNK